MWMKPRFTATLGLLALLLVACAPAATAVSAPTQPPSAAVLPPPSATPAVASLSNGVASTEIPSPTVIPIVTSRGPHLEATDPKTVSMASGGLQFVEFFEFW